MERKAISILSVPLAIAAVVNEGRHSPSGLLANTATAAQMEPPPRQIAALARRIWEAEGCPEGRADAHWLEAESRLRGHFGYLRTLRESTAW